MYVPRRILMLNQLEEAFVSAAKRFLNFQARIRRLLKLRGTLHRADEMPEHYRRYAYHVVFKARRFTARRRTKPIGYWVRRCWPNGWGEKRDYR